MAGEVGLITPVAYDRADSLLSHEPKITLAPASCPLREVD